MKKKTKRGKARKSAGTSKRPSAAKKARKSGRADKSSGCPEDLQVEEISKGIFKEIIARHGEHAYGHFFDSEDGKFNIGGDADAARKELLGSGKRVPDDAFVCRAISEYLQGRGVKEASPSTVYDWMRANQTREGLGGREKAPKISISFYAAVSQNDIAMERRQELLLEAIHNRLTVKELKARICSAYLANNGEEAAVAKGTGADPIDGLERALNAARSILCETFVSFNGSPSEELSWTIANLENLAIYVWQFRDDLAGGKCGGGQ